MPENPPAKRRLHPWQTVGAGRSDVASADPRSGGGTRGGYVELCVTSNFTFLRGASHPEELVERARDLGHAAASIADHNSLAGVVRAHVAAKALRIPLVVGCRLVLEDGTPRAAPAGAPVPRGTLKVLVFPTDRAAYGRLSRLLTLGKRRAEKGACRLGFADLEAHHEGLLAIALPPPRITPGFSRRLADLRRLFDDDRLSLAATCLLEAGDAARLERLAALGRCAGVPLVATNDVHFHVRERRRLQDVLTCVRTGTTIESAGWRLFANGERHLKSPEEMARLFAGHEAALSRTVEIAQRAKGFSLDHLRYEYPDEVCPSGVSPAAHLRALTLRGAAQRYPSGVPDAVVALLEHELETIAALHYEPYFLTVHDLVEFARSRGILCQGRGAAANSAVCFCLGVTALDPVRIDLLFERFVSRERGEPPDIDLDFEHERREEAIQYLYAKYGRERAALTAEVISYRARSAVRDVGKALGLSLDAVDRLARAADAWGDQPPDLTAAGLSAGDPGAAAVIELCREIAGFPRHLSQHVGGFVITRGPLCELVPVENASMADRTVIEWDKDDLDAMGILKVDVLGLGMLTCLRKTFAHLHAIGREAEAAPPPGGSWTLANIPPEDAAVYDMLCEADTVGVFQIESRAQMAMLPRLRPRCFYDLVIEVAIVRPGPIQGGMVHPYLRRRAGEEAVTYPSEAVRRVLKKTLGVPLFQEQAMTLAIVAAGFTPGEADRLRRAMAAWKRKTTDIDRLGARLVQGMVERGYPQEFADRCHAQIRGFSEYGFPESHAASFALLVYVSAWLKCRHPAAFAAALLDSQPMGFYGPMQIIDDAKRHGVVVREVDVHHSRVDCTLEPGPERVPGADAGGARDAGLGGPALRLGLRMVRGLSREHAAGVVEAVARHGPFASIEALHRALDHGRRVPVFALKRLASADAFGSMGLSRQAALWHVRALRDDDTPLFAEAVAERADGLGSLPPIGAAEEVTRDYGALSLSLKAHPVSFHRARLAAAGVVPAAELSDAGRTPHGREVAVAGLVLVRQRPSTAGGIVFFTIEDETGSANLILKPKVFERCLRAAIEGVFVIAHGRVERKGIVVHVQTERLESAGDPFEASLFRSRDFR